MKSVPMTADRRITTSLSKGLSDRIEELRFPQETRSEAIRRLLRYAKDAIEKNKPLPIFSVEGWDSDHTQQFRWDDELADWVESRINFNRTETINYLLKLAVSLEPVTPIVEAEELYNLLAESFPVWQWIEVAAFMPIVTNRVAEKVAVKMLLKLEEQEYLSRRQEHDAPTIYLKGTQRCSHLMLVRGQMMALEQLRKMFGRKLGAEYWQKFAQERRTIFLQSPVITPVAIAGVIAQPEWQRIDVDALGDNRIWYALRQALWQMGARSEKFLADFAEMPIVPGVVFVVDGVEVAIAARVEGLE